MKAKDWTPPNIRFDDKTYEDYNAARTTAKVFRITLNDATREAFRAAFFSGMEWQKAKQEHSARILDEMLEESHLFGGDMVVNQTCTTGPDSKSMLDVSGL